jgi:uncharacterized protein YjiS (DUF1127 family)
MGLFSSLIRSRQSQADRVFRDHIAFLESMSARDRADIGLKAGQIEKTARQMTRK